MEEKISSFKHIETFNTYLIYIQEVLTRIHKHVPMDKICTYHSMNEQYIKRSSKQYKVLLEIVAEKLYCKAMLV